EIIWETRPDVIIETGIAWGGSVVLYASILELIGKGEVYAIDTVLPQHNIDDIKKYNFSNRINLFQGSSTDRKIVENISKKIKPTDRVMVLLDSNHTHEHVYNELQAWSRFVTPGNYLIVSDTVIEEISEQTHRPRPWGAGDNPMTAVNKFLSENNRFTQNNLHNQKALTSYTRNGYLKCI
ncbi:cephalosporin hydroxylase, partial [Candidatus Parcubacteria bacterium]|nr:cephalosporin hydroxylase [Candidatus Parcubacteria bacterium]